MILGRFAALKRAPRCAIVVEVATTYVQCAKAIDRGQLWESESWAAVADVPDGAAILSCQAVVNVDAATARLWLNDGYDAARADEGVQA